MPRADLAAAWAADTMSRREARLWYSLAAAELAVFGLAALGLVTAARWCLR